MLCGHITDDIIMPDGCHYVHWFSARDIPFHLSIVAERPFKWRQGVSCVVRDPERVVDVAKFV